MVSASGGIVSTSDGFTVHKFTTVGSHTLTVSNGKNGFIDVLLVAGGGGGGTGTRYVPGGGGGGG
jgi:hypothetical protein